MAEATLHVTGARMTAASAADRDRGLLGYLRVTLSGGLVLDGLTLRRRAEGDLYVAYPARTTAAGERHPIIRPVGEQARRTFESGVFHALGLEVDGT